MCHWESVCVPVEIVRFALYSRGEDVEAVVHVFVRKLAPVGCVMRGKGIRVPNEGCYGFLNEPVVPPFRVSVFQNREDGVWEGEASIFKFC